jgi:hypothetical protein
MDCNGILTANQRTAVDGAIETNEGDFQARNGVPIRARANAAGEEHRLRSYVCDDASVLKNSTVQIADAAV